VIEVLIKGVLLGLLLSIMIGPAFFTIIQTSIDRGFRSALLIAIGVAISDMFIIFISYLGLSSFIEAGKNEIYAAIIGGVILIFFGGYTFFKKPEILKRRSSKISSPVKTVSPVTFLLKGFFLNIANPSVILFWITTTGIISQGAASGKMDQTAVIFFSGALATIFSMDMVKSFIGYKIKKYLRPRIQLLINRLVGISLAIFGITLIISALFGKLFG